MLMPIRPGTAVAALSLLTIGLIAGSSAALLVDLRQRELSHASIEALGVAKVLAAQTDAALAAADLVLREMHERLRLTRGEDMAVASAALAGLREARLADLPQVASLAIIAADGSVAATPAAAPAALPASECFKAATASFAEAPFIGRPERGAPGAGWTLPLCRRLTGADGRFLGVLVAALKLDYLEDLYGLMKLDFARPVSLHLADGTLVASLPQRAEGPGGDGGLGREALDAAGAAPRMLTGIGTRGERRVFALARVPRFPLLMSVGNDEGEALGAWRETAVPIALGAFVISLVIAGVAVLLARKLAREAALSTALSEADDRYQRTIDTVTDAIIAIDEAQTILLFNQAAERMFGIAAAEAIGSRLERLIPEALRAAHRRYIGHALRLKEPTQRLLTRVESIGRRADGGEFPLEATLSRTLIGGRAQLTAVLRDITERRRAESEQREMNRQLRQLSASLQNVREQERTRIASELHDDLGQQLTGLKLDLSWLSNRLIEGRPAPHDKLAAMRQLLDAAIAAVRRISVELRPFILDDLGFGEAVAWQAAEFSRRSGIAVTLDLQAADRVADEALAIALYRIVQESLTNILRHAGAAQVAVRLVCEGDELVLTVVDDGKGFSAVGKPRNGMGLLSMRERATALGGRFSIEGRAGGGTGIEVRVPSAAPVLQGASA